LDGRAIALTRIAVRAALRGLAIVRRATAAERGLQDRLEVAAVAVNRGDGDDHVEHLFKREVVTDFVSLLRRD
jgi:hypothetical protein